MNKNINLLDTLTPLPYLQIRTLLKLLEAGFSFDQARQIVKTSAASVVDKRHRMVCVAPHSKGWAVFWTGRLKPYAIYNSREEALEQAQCDATADECELQIHADDGTMLEHCAALRNY